VAGKVEITLTGEESRAIRALAAVIEKQRELGRVGAEVGRQTAESAQRATAAQEGLVDQLVGGLTPAGFAVRALKKGYEEFLQVIERVDATAAKSAENLKRASAPIAALSQFSGGDPARQSLLTDAAKRTAREAGISLADAAKLTGGLSAAGLGDERSRRLAIQLQAVGIDPTRALGAAVNLQRGFGAGARAGDAQDLASIVGKANAAAPGRAEELLAAAGSAAPLARRLGVSGDELLATTAITGGGGASALLRGLERRKITGGVDAALDKFGGRSHSSLVRALGSEEAANAFEAIANDRDRFAAVQARVAGTGGISALESAARSDPTVRAAQDEARAAAANEATKEDLGRKRLVREAGRSSLERGLREAGVPELAIEGLSTLRRINGLPAQLLQGELEERVGAGQGAGISAGVSGGLSASGSGLGAVIESLRGIERNTRSDGLVIPGADR
jgi:hypothetical protein